MRVLEMFWFWVFLTTALCAPRRIHIFNNGNKNEKNFHGKDTNVSEFEGNEHGFYLNNIDRNIIEWLRETNDNHVNKFKSNDNLNKPNRIERSVENFQNDNGIDKNFHEEADKPTARAKNLENQSKNAKAEANIEGKQTGLEGTVEEQSSADDVVKNFERIERISPTVDELHINGIDIIDSGPENKDVHTNFLAHKLQDGSPSVSLSSFDKESLFALVQSIFTQYQRRNSKRTIYDDGKASHLYLSLFLSLILFSLLICICFCLTQYHTMPHFDSLQIYIYICGKHSEKRRNSL